MDGKRLIRSIKLTNLLSFGPKGEEIELEPLNVLIGPNASGKSNFIEAIELLHAAPRDLAAAISRTGGITESIWKGGDPSSEARIDVVVAYRAPLGDLRYHLGFALAGLRHRVVSEELAPEDGAQHESTPPFFYRFCEGVAVSYGQSWSSLATSNHDEQAQSTWLKYDVPLDRIDPRQSALSQFKDLTTHLELYNVGAYFGAITLYRDWNIGREFPPRRPQPTDLPEHFLLEDAKNLWMVLNDLQNRPETWKLLLARLKRFYDGVEDVTTKVQGNTVQAFLHERGLKRPIPATRLSDGTLRFLCLLAILCHPEPPPLVVIEEPELGLHPDALGLVAELLLEASQRMQLIVTTHSDALVSELSEVPESVLVCERDDEGSHLRRLDKDRLQEWLEEYMLGDLWRMGKIGGNP